MDSEISFDRESSLELREAMIGFRDEAMNQWPAGIPATVALTYLVGWMHIAINTLWPESVDQGTASQERSDSESDV